MELEIGKVTHYFGRIGVAAILLTGELNIGDTILILGHTTDLQQRISSMQVDRKKIDEAGPGMEVAVLVGERVRQGDTVFKVLEP